MKLDTNQIIEIGLNTAVGFYVLSLIGAFLAWCWYAPRMLLEVLAILTVVLPLCYAIGRLFHRWVLGDD